MPKVFQRLALLGALLVAVVAIPALYNLIPSAPALAPRASDMAIAGEVEAGFVGILNFGNWRLICEPVGEGSKAENICRINQEVSARDRPSEVILAANFRMLRKAQRTVLVMRLPITANAGDKVVLRFGDYVLKIPVQECTDGQCLARAELDFETWEGLLRSTAVQAVLPAAEGRRAMVDIPVDGLAQAAAALGRAQGL
ncbi:MAG: invasion associated locus B family protein [Alphaproteobacteria bacterium]